MPDFYNLLADAIVVIHFGYVAFVILGQLAILVGWPLRWRWTRNMVFRCLHLSAITIVVLEALGGVQCPLTTWENQLRQAAGQTSSEDAFIANWMHNAMFLDAPLWVFTLCYALFGLLVMTTFILVPPWRSVRRAPQTSDGESTSTPKR